MLRKLNELTKKKIVHEIFVNGAFFQKSHAKKRQKMFFVSLFFCCSLLFLYKSYSDCEKVHNIAATTTTIFESLIRMKNTRATHERDLKVFSSNRPSFIIIFSLHMSFKK